MICSAFRAVSVTINFMEGEKVISDQDSTFSTKSNSKLKTPAFYNQKVLVVGLVVIGFLVLANIWLVKDILTNEKINDLLPRIDLNPFKATVLIFSAGENLKSNTWTEPKNILILGRAGKGNRAPNLTDTIIVAHVDPSHVQPELKLISIPRDFLVRLDNPERFLKLNALWPYAQARTEGENGLAIVKEKIEELTSLRIDSVLVFDLNTVRQVIEQIDGITVLVEDIYDPRFPTAAGGYETFSLQEGWRYLNADEALKFIRTRASPLGDFDRIHHQQELLRAIKGKLVSLNPVWNFPTLWSIFKIVRSEIITDLTLEDTRNLWFVSNQVSWDQIQTISLDVASSLVKPKTVRIGGLPAYTLVARGDPFDYSEIRKAIREFISD